MYTSGGTVPRPAGAGRRDTLSRDGRSVGSAATSRASSRSGGRSGSRNAAVMQQQKRRAISPIDLLRSGDRRKWPLIHDSDRELNVREELQQHGEESIISFSLVQQAVDDYCPPPYEAINNLTDRLDNLNATLASIGPPAPRHPTRPSTRDSSAPSAAPGSRPGTRDRRTSVFALTEVDAGRRRTQLSGYPSSSTSTHIMPHVTSSRLDGVTQRVEIATFPGFSDSGPTPLPGLSEPRGIMFRAMKHVEVPSQRLRKFFKKYAISKCSIDILQDMFWWFFIDLFQANEAVKASIGHQLYARMGTNFVALMWNVPPVHHDMFFKQYHNVLAQGIYSAFCHSYPKSLQKFDDDFKEYVTNTVYQWFTGFKPSSSIWQSWSIETLVPPGTLSIVRKNQDNDTDVPGSSSTDGGASGASHAAAAAGDRRKRKPSFRPSSSAVGQSRHDVLASLLLGTPSSASNNGSTGGSGSGNGGSGGGNDTLLGDRYRSASISPAASRIGARSATPRRPPSFAGAPMIPGLLRTPLPGHSTRSGGTDRRSLPDTRPDELSQLLNGHIPGTPGVAVDAGTTPGSAGRQGGASPLGGSERADRASPEVPRLRLPVPSGNGDSCTLVTPRPTRALFDVTGNSPLVMHYLEQRDTRPVFPRRCFMTRSEMPKSAPPGALTFRQIIMLSNRISHRLDRRYERQREAAQAEIACLRQELETAKSEQDAEWSDALHHDVHGYANYLMTKKKYTDDLKPLEKQEMPDAISRSRPLGTI